MHGITLTKAPADWEILQQENGKASVALKETFRFIRQQLKWVLKGLLRL